MKGGSCRDIVLSDAIYLSWVQKTCNKMSSADTERRLTREKKKKKIGESEGYKFPMELIATSPRHSARFHIIRISIKYSDPPTPTLTHSVCVRAEEEEEDRLFIYSATERT